MFRHQPLPSPTVSEKVDLCCISGVVSLSVLWHNWLGIRKGIQSEINTPPVTGKIFKVFGKRQVIQVNLTNGLKTVVYVGNSQLLRYGVKTRNWSAYQTGPQYWVTISCKTGVVFVAPGTWVKRKSKDLKSNKVKVKSTLLKKYSSNKFKYPAAVSFSYKVSFHHWQYSGLVYYALKIKSEVLRAKTTFW